jgi:tyrosyl-DNA phosphodiesterase 2
MASRPQARMAGALNHLEELLSSIPAASAVVVFLQEMQEHRGQLQNFQDHARDIKQLCESPWVRQGFNLTDISTKNWDASYGQVTLVDRRLSITQVARLKFVSEYQRDAVLVDIPIASQQGKILRLSNVHLDSASGTMRPVQWKGIEKHLQDHEAGVAASILAGDCNANQPRDKTEPQNNGFKDAYLELGGVEGEDEGATWGFQSTFWKRWGRQRLDKVVYWGDVTAKSLERIGVGVKLEDKSLVKELAKNDELPFVTDHYGLMSELSVKDGLRGVSDAEESNNDE